MLGLNVWFVDLTHDSRLTTSDSSGSYSAASRTLLTAAMISATF
jgi:hypothetical protein